MIMLDVTHLSRDVWYLDLSKIEGTLYAAVYIFCIASIIMICACGVCV
jgi:hypothetical protein